MKGINKRGDPKKGFTVAELLIVLAIIGVLVAVGLPIYSNNLKKAKIAVNKANIRVAKAKAAERINSLGFESVVVGNGLKARYFAYDVKNGILEDITGNQGGFSYYHDLGNVQKNKANKYEICDFIYIYAGESDKSGKKTGLSIETAPFYVGDKVGENTNKNNPFGWSQ